MLKKSGAVNSCSVGNMSPLSQNITALLELPVEDQGIPHITAETSGNISGVVFTWIISALKSLYEKHLHLSAPSPPVYPSGF